jgi:tyrosyl-tRNA synthetase
MTLSEELTWRGFVNQTTFDDIKELDKTKRTFYWGVDPSASSMQVGNLAAAMMARVFIKHGYKPVLLVGGATGLIGDPDGKAQERDLKTPEEIAKNKEAIIKQYKQIFKGEDFKIVDNYEWFKDMGYLEFLREVGKHVPLRQMIGRDFVQSRVSEGGAGISYAEFSYSLIQGYDFLHLFEKHDVTLQLSGADQWGNSIAGVDLIRRKTGKEAHVWTTPLIINKATGVKFGKTEDGAVWLDANQTTPYEFYQFWLNVDDDGVEDYLKVYTELSKSEIDDVIKEFSHDKGSRAAQKALAYEVTKLVHGAVEAEAQSTRVIFTAAEYQKFTKDDFEKLASQLAVHRVHPEAGVIDVVVASGLASSNSEARRFMENGAIYINGEQIDVSKKALSKGDWLHKYVVIRRGKNTQALLTTK